MKVSTKIIIFIIILVSTLNFQAYGKTPSIFVYEGSSKTIGNLHGLKFGAEIRRTLAEFQKEIIRKGYSKEAMDQMLLSQEETLFRYVPSLLKEYRAIAEAAGVSYMDILALHTLNRFGTMKFGVRSDECTSWVAVGAATRHGKSMLHKNRDMSRDTQVVFKVRRIWKNSYIALSTSPFLTVTSGMNDKGLAICNNVIGFDNLNLFGLNAFAIHRKVLEEADTVEDAYEMIKGFPRLNANIFFVVDREKGAIIETSPTQISSFEDSVIINNVGARANMFEVLPGPPDLDSIRRSGAAKAFLRQYFGSLSIPEMNMLSRHVFIYKEGIVSKNDFSISSKPVEDKSSTLYGATYVMDKAYPAELNTLWFALGTTTAALYSPIHFGSLDIYDLFEKGDAYLLSEKLRLAKGGPYQNLMPEFIDMESHILTLAGIKENKALEMLNTGKSKTACEILTTLDLDMGSQVINMLTELSLNNFWKDSFTDNSGIYSMKDISLSLGEKKNPTLKEILNGNDMASYYVKKAYQVNAEVFSLFGGPSTQDHEIEILEADVHTLKNSDDSRYLAETFEASKRALLKVEMQIQEEVDNIHCLDFIFEGYSDSPREFEIYLLRYGKSSTNGNVWERLSSWYHSSVESDNVFVGTLCINPEEFIGPDGKVTWLAGYPNRDSGSTLWIDQVRLDVIRNSARTGRYQILGEIISKEISWEEKGSWEGTIFKARHFIPDNTTIRYRILDAKTHQVLGEMDSQSAALGVSLSRFGMDVSRSKIIQRITKA